MSASSALHDAHSPRADDDPPGLELLEDPFDELGLDAERLLAGALEPIELLDRPHDRLARGLTVEALDAEVVVEQVRDPALEAVESCQLVLADRDQEVRAEVVAAECPRQLSGDRPRPAILAVVQERLLELVENDQHLAAESLAQLGEAGAQLIPDRKSVV